MDEIPDYPSKIILNWADIQDKAEEKEKEYNALKEKFETVMSEPLPKEEANKASKLRGLLLEKVKAKRDAVEEAENRIKGEDI